MPLSSHPLATNRRYGVVADISPTDGTIGVDIGGDNAGNDWDSGAPAYCATLDSYAVPTVGDVVLLLGIPGDWCIVGKVGGPGIGYSRYTWARVATVGANVFIDCGTPPATPWSSGSINSGISRITITKRCHLDLWLSWDALFSIALTYTVAAVPQAWSGHHFAESQAGGVYKGEMQLSAIVEVNDTIDMQARNAGGGTLTFKGFATFTDATFGVIQN